VAAPPLRTTRAYHSPLRQERAAQTRRRIISSAADAFSELGYAGATVARIAAGAGVSADTVMTVGTKAFLLLEAFRTRYTGEGGWASVLEQASVQDLLAIEDADAALDALVEFLSTAHNASADLWLAIRATALVEPLVAEGFAELSRLKEESFGVTVDWLLRIGLLPPLDGDPGDPAPRHRLTANVNLVMSAETWVQLTRDWHFGDEEYRAWLRRTIPAIRP
jgi:AcrR family transcriptional regulator